MDIEISGYTLLRTIGKGGMATVYLARQDVLERRVALKVMSRSLAEDPTFGARFMREAKIVSQLVHPNIVTVHEVGQHEGRYYLSMEYIDGHDLRTVRKRLDLAGKIRVIEDIARALHYAGEKGYVHRDIKPENIMFRSTDGSAVLTDFGIAKAVKNDLTMTQTGTAIGTPHYMSPEQAKGKNVDHRSDLYSLGVVFYLLLTGRVPYDADTAIAIGIKHLTEAIPQLPSEYHELQFILDGLMAKDPSDRYQSGIALLNDLRRIDLYEIERQLIDSDQTPTVSSHVPTDSAYAADEHNRDDSKRFTLEFDAIEPAEKPPRAILPSLFASIFVFCAIAFFIYMARPAFWEPHISSLEQKIAAYYQLSVEKSSILVKQIDTMADQQFSKSDDAVERSKSDEYKSAAQSDTDDRIEASEALTHGETQSSIKEVIENNFGESNAELEEVSETKDEQFVAGLAFPSLPELSAELSKAQARASFSGEDFASYIRAHQSLLKYYPNDQDTRISLENLKTQRHNDVFDVARRGERIEAEKRLQLIKALFYQDGLAEEFSRLSTDVQTELKIYELLEAADALVKQGNLYQSEEGSRGAVQTLKQVLTLDEGNEAATAKLGKITSVLYSRSTKARKAGDLQQAQALANQAVLSTSKGSDGHKQSLTLLAAIESELKSKALLDRALQDAARYKELDYLFLPEGANAYDAYQRALDIAPKNETATEGLQSLLDALSVKVWRLAGEAKFDQAKQALARPISLMPDNERLQSMFIAVDDASKTDAASTSVE